MATAKLDANAITDWDTFHSVCAAAFGFPDFYGRHMNAFVDCLTYVREGDGMSKFVLAPGEMLSIEISRADAFFERVPEIASALMSAVASINERQIEESKPPVISLLLL